MGLPGNTIKNISDSERDGVFVIWIVSFEKRDNLSQQGKVFLCADISLMLQRVDEDYVETPRDAIE